MYLGCQSAISTRYYKKCFRERKEKVTLNMV